MSGLLGKKQQDEPDRLCMAVAEELKVPMLHIARRAELQGYRSIQSSADMALRLLDSYVLSLQLRTLADDADLEQEPVALSAVLYDTVAALRQTAQAYGVSLRVRVQGRTAPVLAHRQALQSALMSLSYAVISALPASDVGDTADGTAAQVQLVAHRTRQGMVVGVYAPLNLTPQAYRQARSLYGTVRQPLTSSMPGSGAGVFVADSILATMKSRVHVGRFMKLSGFAVTLPLSEQLQLI